MRRSVVEELVGGRKGRGLGKELVVEWCVGFEREWG